MLRRFSILRPEGNAMQSVGCSLPGSSVHGILQAKILVWVTMLSSRGSSQPSDRTQVPCISWITGWFFMAEPPGEPPLYVIGAQKILVERMNTTLTMMWKPLPPSFISHDSFRPQGAIIFRINTPWPSLSPVFLLFPCGGMILPSFPLDNSPSPLKTQLWLYLVPWCPCDNNPPCIEPSFRFLPRLRGTTESMSELRVRYPKSLTNQEPWLKSSSGDRRKCQAL